MTFNETKALIALCENRNIKKFGVNGEYFEVEFFPSKSSEIDPVQIAKALTDHMPPDSQMLFAATEDMPELKDE